MSINYIEVVSCTRHVGLVAGRFKTRGPAAKYRVDSWPIYVHVRSGGDVHQFSMAKSLVMRK